MTYEEIIQAFQQLYPTEFKHVYAAVEAAELRRELEELKGDNEGTIQED